MSSLNLFQHAETTALAAGHVIFNAGDRGDNMYVVVEGKVDIKIGDVLLDSFGLGDIFGEMALIDRSPRSATAVVSESAKLAVVDERGFIRLVQHTPYFALELMGLMAKRLRNTNARLAIGH